MRFKERVVDVIGRPPVARAIGRLGGRALRIVAYHGVPDPRAFQRHLDWMTAEFTLVSGTDVAEAIRHRTPLPDRALWLTFDDGDETVVTNALEILESYQAPATMFVSPGLVDTSAPPWWSTVTTAVQRGWKPPQGQTPDDVIRHLKLIPDRNRRSIVALADHYLEDANEHLEHSVGPTLLSRWHDSGRELGNHTWDHPCLDRCDLAIQQEQIERADTWLAQFGAFEHCRLFAYPNGGWTPHAEDALRDLGYDVALLFDHRLAQLSADPLRMSRLRLDSSAQVSRMRSILSGGHTWFVGLVGSFDERRRDR